MQRIKNVCIKNVTVPHGSAQKQKSVLLRRSEGQLETCGLYVVAGPEHLVEVTVEDIDVDCQDGLLMVGLHSLCLKSIEWA